MAGKIIIIIFRSIATYIILLVLGRVIGRKLISRITLFDFMVGITMGSIAVRIALGSQESPYLAAISITVITILVAITDYLDIKSINFRKMVDGEPIVLISNGKLLDYNLKKVRININKLMMQLREKDIFNLEDVALAAIESDGELTVLKNQNKTKTSNNSSKDMPNYGLICDIIIDGKIMYNNLKGINQDEQWLREQLQTHNIYELSEVFYAGLNSQGILYVSPRTKP